MVVALAIFGMLLVLLIPGVAVLAVAMRVEAFGEPGGIE
jgi:hypothetical protein